MNETNYESLGSEIKALAKEKVKELFEKKRPRKQLDTRVHPQTNHTIVDQGCSWTTPWKIVWVMFLNWVFIKASLHHIFWEIVHFWEFQLNETN